MFSLALEYETDEDSQTWRTQNGDLKVGSSTSGEDNELATELGDKMKRNLINSMVRTA